MQIPQATSTIQDLTQLVLAVGVLIGALSGIVAAITGILNRWSNQAIKTVVDTAAEHIQEAAKDSKTAVAQNSAAVVRREQIASDIKDIKETRSAELIAAAALDVMPDILLVDDLEHSSFELSLTRKGLTVMCFDNGKDALEWLKTHQVKLLLTDLALAGLDGWSIIEQFRSQFPERTEKIAVLTGHASPQDAELAERYDVVKILDKNLGFEVIANEIQSILGSV